MIIIVFSRTLAVLGPAIETILTATVSLLGGGGKIADQTETVLTETVSLLGGGGQATRIETALTETVILALGSYP